MSRTTHVENTAAIAALVALLFTPLMPAEVSLVVIGLVLVGLLVTVAVGRARTARRGA